MVPLVVLAMTLEAIALLKDAKRKLMRQVDAIDELIASIVWLAAESIECDCGGHEDGLHSKHCKRRMHVTNLEHGELI